jgi:hypothetical protein
MLDQQPQVNGAQTVAIPSNSSSTSSSSQAWLNHTMFSMPLLSQASHAAALYYGPAVSVL